MDILVVPRFINGFLMIALPIGLAIYLEHRTNLEWRLFGIGAVTFILSQAGHIPFNWGIGKLLNQSDLISWSPVEKVIFSAVFLGLSAGLFEETARYLVLRFWIRDVRSWRSMLMFGAGHGGIEAIILGVLVLLSFFSMLAYRNMDLSEVIPASQLELAQQQIAAYWSAPWFTTILGAVERGFGITCHIFMSVLVMQVFTRKNILWLFVAIGYHALMDGAVVIGSTYLGIYWTEALLGGFAVLGLVLIFTLRKPELRPIGEVTLAPSVISPLNQIEETPDNLERSRYQE